MVAFPLALVRLPPRSVPLFLRAVGQQKRKPRERGPPRTQPKNNERRKGGGGWGELECGDIGIFVYDDCGYLKKYDEHTPDKSQAEFLTDSYGVVHNQPVLVSLNTKYSPILISPEQRFEIVGKVLN